jgi:hypothetical protein
MPTACRPHGWNSVRFFLQIPGLAIEKVSEGEDDRDHGEHHSRKPCPTAHLRKAAPFFFCQKVSEQCGWIGVTVSRRARRTRFGWRERRFGRPGGRPCGDERDFPLESLELVPQHRTLAEQFGQAFGGGHKKTQPGLGCV